MKKNIYLIVFFFIIIFILNCSSLYSNIDIYEVQIIREIPHKGDRLFTQGFEYYNNYLYEGTGRKRQTALKKIDIHSGEIISQLNVEDYYPNDIYFGEGITIWNNEIIQLTWKAKKAYVFSINFDKTDKSFTYNTQGWGLTHNNKYLIMSDGSKYLYYRDPTTFKIIDKKYIGIDELNELEYVNGIIYANVWKKKYILMIDDYSGRILGKIDAQNLICTQQNNDNDVLNGIAYNPVTNTFYLTGKNCPLIYEVKFKKRY